VLLLKSKGETVSWKNQNWLISRLYTISGIDDDGIKLYHHQEARTSTDARKFMNDVVNKQKFEDVIPDLQNIENVNVEQLKKELNDPDTKPKDFFERIQVLLNNHYDQNNIVDKKGKVKKIKLKESSLTSPKGGLKDVIDNYRKFPYIKVKVNDFNAALEGIDFKITPTGKIAEL
jgi:CRISPR-associated endonuclease Csn1